ncbi:uncharacterized protein LOC120672603 isoform X5 [Panicum virgatum]|uniref:WIYLD domain-containing protein n=1 Tax=Panicum virgatum TaxID=38727 RepID=A0A8T0VZ02_PANVG|nr:uncharacterized protein LOC120672603 isoform X5 [Panicum virgatum]XP_039809075.1 uncharacterized protein LOC120672603 isoform X5 [Panicum virgatum]KAG2642188.1 hypothetical protein PVAP13_2KG259300 [Panicum virgatum]KAG2642189.1 hypothetical protein PVAP13_2KG259300 [Panicum virgatum]KAG2642190.1 hypothetical protein PVAP13_2KG259300 [Panicum virgatum]KAG2642191.1 hypothetical protein PVAP13_2KG259300 [Panicum virgatum]KAG2642192.1 hypothetical protein PVAP13_2KG259300 [Panicum virgatum]
MPPPPEGPPGKGDGRIDAAVDYFIAMGYAARDVRNVVEALLTVHGGAAAWPSLAEGSYRAVQEKLLEKEEEEVKLLLMGGEPASTSVSLLVERFPLAIFRLALRLLPSTVQASSLVLYAGPDLPSL